MRNTFCPPEPWTFQLQVSYNGGDEWEDVGEPFTGAFFALDDEERLCAKDMRLTYRVVMTDGDGVVYESEAAHILGGLSKREWLQYRAATRRCLLQPRQMEQFEGMLLKRKITGEKCTCIDPATGGITDSGCETCYGTGFTSGYWKAGETIMFDMSPELRYTQNDNQMQRGTVNDLRGVAKCVGIPLINTFDVWVDTSSGRRYIIHKCQNKAEIDQVPVVTEIEVRMAGAGDAVYNIDLETL